MGATAFRHALFLILRLFSEDWPLQGGPQWQSAHCDQGDPNHVRRYIAPDANFEVMSGIRAGQISFV